MANKYADLIQQAATSAGVDPAALTRQIEVESNFDPNAESHAGALGIAQIVPKYWQGQYGLNSREDFLNPEKAIPAMANIMAQLTRQHGSWEAGLVAYNAGPGKKGKNIANFNAGNWAALPEETQGYLRKLGVLPAGEASGTKTPGVLGASGAQADLSSGLYGTEGAARKYEPNPDGFADSFVPGVKHGAIGTIARRDQPLSALLGGSANLDEATLEKIRQANIGSAGVTFVVRNAIGNGENVDELIKLAQENRESAGKERTLMGDLSYGLGEMVSDPVTYGTLPFGGIATKPAQLFSQGIARASSKALLVAGEGALTNMASESLRESTTGTDADIATAAAAGAAFGLGIAGIGKAASKVFGKAPDSLERAVHRTEAHETQQFLKQNGYTDAGNPTIFTPMDIDAETGIKWKDRVYDEIPLEKKLFGAPLDVGEAGGNTGNIGKKVPALLQLKNGDTVHTASGVQFSAANPLNPAYAKAVDPNLRGLPGVEIMDVLQSSANADLRDFSFNLGRSTRGTVDGGWGKQGVVAEDVVRTLKGEHMNYEIAKQDLRDEILRDPAFQNSGLTKAELRQTIDERVGKALVSKDTSALTKPELKLYQLMDERYKALGELQVTPGARWGIEAPSLLPEDRLRTDYGRPIVYDRQKINALADQIGHEDLQELIARSFMSSYIKDANVQKAVKEAIKNSDNPQMTPREFANRTAYGIVQSADPLDGVDITRMIRYTEGATAADTSLPGFRKGRTAFGHTAEIDIPNSGGQKFSVADLFSYDLDSIDTAYFNRVAGDVSLTASTGMPLDTVLAKVEGFRAAQVLDPSLKSDVAALEKMVNGLYGVGARSQSAQINAIESIFKNLAFMKSSAYMALMNFMEIAAGVREHGVSFMAQAVPGFGKMVSSLKHGKLTAENLHLAQNLTWGPELDRVIHPTYSQSIERTTSVLEAAGQNGLWGKTLGAVQGTVAATSDRFWTTQALRATTRSIVEASRQEFFADLAKFAHGVIPEGTSGFASYKRAAAASVNKDQMDGIVGLLKEAVMFKDGQMHIVNPELLYTDPRAAALRRYGQFWSERVIQQNSIGATFRWAGLPLVGMLTQFMSFAYRSFNAKLVRGTSNIFRNGDIGEALDLLVLAPALSGLGYAGVTYLQGTKFTDANQRQKFMEERLGGKGEWGPLIAGGLKRSPAMAMPSWLYDGVGSTPLGQGVAPDFFQYAGYGKTSTEAKLRKDAQNQSGVVGGFLGDSIEQAPAVKTVDSLIALGTAPVKKMLPSDTFDEEKFRKQWQGALRGLIPNDPVSQRLFVQYLQDPY
jgi:hypothetical protein